MQESDASYLPFVDLTYLTHTAELIQALILKQKALQPHDMEVLFAAFFDDAHLFWKREVVTNICTKHGQPADL